MFYLGAEFPTHEGEGGYNGELIAWDPVKQQKVWAEEATPLRICADPSNPPFSTDDPKILGVDVEIANALGHALGRPVSFVWYRTYFGGRAVRVTMLSKQCDATIGLPDDKDFMGPKVIFSRPLYNLSYALI